MREHDVLLRARWGAQTTDELLLYPIMQEPGEVITRAERDARFPEAAAKERPVLGAIDRAELSYAMANVRSQRGHVARLLALHLREHQFSDVECAYLSTLADLASLALSGCVSSAR